MSVDGPCTGRAAYDVLAAYMRSCLRKQANSESLNIEELLPVKDKEYDDSDLIDSITDLATTIVANTFVNIRNVTTERTAEINTITNLRLEFASKVKPAYESMMTGWLKNDDHLMTWDRVIMLMVHTATLINHNFITNGDKAKQRIVDLVGICADFVDRYMYTWISLNGGWRGLEKLYDELSKNLVYDIPYTSLGSRRSNGGRASSTSAVNPLKKSGSDSDPRYPISKSHDVIVAYVKQNLMGRDNSHHKLDAIMEKLKESLAEKKNDLSGSDVVKAMAAINKKITPATEGAYKAVKAHWKAEIKKLLSVSLPIFLVWVEFDKLMFSWFINDQHPMVWERILVVVEFACDLIYEVSQGEDEKKLLRKVQDIVNMAVKFINGYCSTWLTDIGGWENIVSMKESLIKQDSYDIPSTAIYSPTNFPLPPVKFISYPPERLQSIQLEARLSGPEVILNLVQQILKNEK